jgi:hypothetical protein
MGDDDVRGPDQSESGGKTEQKWLTTFGARHEVCRGGTSEAQPTAWAKIWVITDPFHGSPERPV